MPGPATQKEIAKYLKVHPSTVCLALKKDPRVPRRTLERVQEAAAKLGYVRDPMLAALAAYRQSRRPRGFHGTLAWLVTSAPNFDWRSYRDYSDYYEGACQRAKELGYRLVVFDMHEYTKRPARLLGIFRARNIRGVIVCPQPQIDTILDLDFSQLSGVSIGYTLRSPSLHSITVNHYASVREICDRLYHAGHRRIGFIVPEEHNRRLNGTPLAAFLLAQLDWRPRDRLPHFTGIFEEGRTSSIADWFKKQRPDALIAASYQMSALGEVLQRERSQKIDVALVAVIEGYKNYSGIDENSVGIGRTAADTVVSMVEHSATGTPSNPQRILIQGRWHEGSSIGTAERPVAGA